MHLRRSATAAAITLSLVTAACTSSAVAPQAAPSATTAPSITTTPSATATPSATPPPTATAASTPARAPTASARPTQAARTLPLSSSTGSARQVLTVTAPDTSSTTATLQAWTKAASGWRKSGPSVPAHLGSDGMSAQASETKSATPIGSFTLTRAFGHDSNPGTALSYIQTSPSDWWISQPGELYNTFQDCRSRCSFTQGAPNEHLYYETPFYDYAVVIDYNTANAPGGIKPGKGSAFFLHVTDGNPTAGCISIPMAQLVRIMRWLNPAKRPRIMIGLR